MKIGVDRTTGLNRTMTSWKSNNDPSLGSYYGFMDIQGDPELYIYSGSQKIWRTGAWNGVHFSGMPDLSNYQDFTFNFTNNNQEVTYSYAISNQSFVSVSRIDPSGVLQRMVWLWDSSRWNVYWYTPKDQCDNFGKCGPYGACDPNNLPVCECLLSVFRPANPANWQLRDGTDGCVRETNLDCNNGTDGLLPVSNVKLTESDNSTVHYGLSLDKCRALCLTNCSCTAYASANVSGVEVGA